MLVPASELQRVEAICREAAVAWRVGPPLHDETKVGPLVNESARDRVQGVVRQALAEGARLVTGGPDVPEGLNKGFFVAPTVLSDVDPDTWIAKNEVFGPVLTIHTYRDLDEAVEIANSTSFGLSGGVWSGDHTRGVAIAKRMKTGQVSLNGAPQNFATPFGGYGLSGIGRENGRFGIEEFQQYKAVHGAIPAVS
jgi:aldehyde dehydrogenase (NAD+)